MSSFFGYPWDPTGLQAQPLPTHSPNTTKTPPKTPKYHTPHKKPPSNTNNKSWIYTTDSLTHNTQSQYTHF